MQVCGYLKMCYIIAQGPYILTAALGNNAQWTEVGN